MWTGCWKGQKRHTLPNCSVCELSPGWLQASSMFRLLSFSFAVQYTFFSSKQVMNINKIFIDGILAWCTYRFSELTLKEMYGLSEENWHFDVVSASLFVSTSFRDTETNSTNLFLSIPSFFCIRIIFIRIWRLKFAKY